MTINQKIIFILIVVVCSGAFFGFGVWLGVAKIAYHVPQPGTIDFSLFWDAYNKLQQNFINPEKIDNQKIVYGAIEGMAKTLDDPYTDFFDPEQALRFEQDLSGSFEGIGVEIGIRKSQLTVVAPLEGTPGQKAGLMAGDTIVRIDGKESIDITTEEAVNRIRGPKGTIVTLTIMRNGWTTTRDIEITRATIKIPPMEWSIKDGDVAYIKLFQFDQSLSVDFATATAEILQSPAKKIILDLRNNPGGYLEVAQNIAGWFLKYGQTVTIEDFGNNQSQIIYKSQGNGDLSEYPIVVLINQGSASASEILAGSLRDNRNVELIGTKSFGKGSVQEVIDLRGGSFLKVTIAKWLTPNGTSISDVGLDPDVKVDMTEDDINQQKDPQLDKALEIIKTMQ